MTTHVPALETALVHRALQTGLQRAQQLQAAGLIEHAALVCQDWMVSLDYPEPRALRTMAFPRLTETTVGAVIA